MNFSQLLQMRASETDGGRRGLTLPGTAITDPSQMREAGFRSVQAGRNPRYERAFSEALRLYDRVLSGDRWAGLVFREALSTSDFPNLFGDIIDRSVLANYAETPYTWDQYCKRATISDFRLAKIFRIDRGAGVLDGPILPNSFGASGSGPTGLEEVSEYPMRKRADSKYTDQLYKFGARMDFAWETLINDDLDALKDTPALFGRAARRTEEKRATKLFVSSTGPNATFFSNANKNLINSTVASFVTTNNPPLSITSLAWALQIMYNQLDLDGEPISIEGVTLVIPPALKITANNIIRATQVWMNDQGGTTGISGSGATQTAPSLQRLLTTNWANGVVSPAVNYYLPVVDTTHGQTGWYLFANPNLGRPALQQSFLRGHLMPEMFMKLPNNVAIGEGRMGPGAGVMPGTSEANPMEGDFDTDAICYKVRHVLGGTLLDPIMAVASNGSGS
jgi:hypothetical protein